MKKVLITGAAGIIGTVLRRHLAEYDITPVDIVPLDDPAYRRIDVASEYEKLLEATQGQDAVVHLARNPRQAFNTNAYFQEDMQMARNILDAALDTAPRPRVILASSVHAVGRYVDWDRRPYSFVRRKEFGKVTKPLIRITADMTPMPDSVYSSTKVAIERLGKLYSFRGLEVIALRLGGVNPGDKADIDEENWCYHSSWLSHRDCTEIFRRCVEAELPPFSLLFAVSNNRWSIFDVSRTAEMLGYTPQDDSARFFQ